MSSVVRKLLKVEGEGARIHVSSGSRALAYCTWLWQPLQMPKRLLMLLAMLLLVQVFLVLVVPQVDLEDGSPTNLEGRVLLTAFLSPVAEMPAFPSATRGAGRMADPMWPTHGARAILGASVLRC